MRRLLPLLALVPLTGCLEMIFPPDPEPPGDILEELNALPGVTATEWTFPNGFEPEAGYRYFDITFTQSMNHDLPGETFQQHGWLMHRDYDAPLLFYTSGYGGGWKRYLSEPAAVMRANQLSIDYRFYAGSRPENPDWKLLTVRQNVEDEHSILEWMNDLYTGSVIQTGGSKGGETALFHMFYRPEDLDGVIAYVAPVLTELPDPRYATILDDIGIDACTNKLRTIQRTMLGTQRKAQLDMRAAMDAQFTIAGVSHAVETAIVELEFSFWMTRGEKDCDKVPATNASDMTLYQFLKDTSPPSAYGDAALLEYGQQYLYQDIKELGYPVWQHAHLDDLMKFTYEDWSAYLPIPAAMIPLYDARATRALDAWLQTGPDNIIFIGGEWDPWSAGYPTIPTDNDTLVFSVPHGTHWSAGMHTVEDIEFEMASAALRRWTGATTARTAPTPKASMATRGPSVLDPSLTIR